MAYEHPIVGILRERREAEEILAQLRSVVETKEVKEVPVLSAYVILMTSESPPRVCMTEELKKGQRIPKWGFLGGGRRVSEKPHETAMREVLEESSLTVKVGEENLLVSFHIRDDRSRRGNWGLKCFYRVVVSEAHEPHPGTDQLKVCWMPFIEVLALEVTGQMNVDHARALQYFISSTRET